ncbi:MAG: hypothetical protein JNL74_00935 [Fibrobacteres bacterium]|nr:hypothetical protein [Fibrobacterota bacterium]
MSRRNKIFKCIITASVFTMLPFLTFSCSQTKKLAIAEAAAELSSIDKSAPAIVQADDLKDLPAPVKRYLTKSGVVGKPHTKMFRTRFTGRMKLGGEEDKWREVSGFQYSFIESTLTRIFYIETRMYGVPVVGRDRYFQGHGNMLIKLMDKFAVVNATGESMDKSALITFLNDMMFFPSAMLTPFVKWAPVNDSTALATITDKGKTVSGLFYFNKEDEIVNFVTDDRTYDNGRGDVRKARWWTPVIKHADVNNVHIPVAGSAEWDFGDRRFLYADFKFSDIDYNSFELYKEHIDK